MANETGISRTVFGHLKCQATSFVALFCFLVLASDGFFPFDGKFAHIAKNDVIELWSMPTFFAKYEQNKAT